VLEQTLRIRNYFDAAAGNYARSREREFSFGVQKRIALDMLPAKMERVLDAGCGPAVMAQSLLERAGEYWGVDLSGEMIAYGRSRMAGEPRCRLSVANAEALEFPAEFFDAVVSLGMLEYLLSYERALAGIFRVLRPGGVAVFAVPNRGSVYYRAGMATVKARALVKRLRGRPPQGTEHFITNRCVPARLDADLKRAGFAKVAARYCNFIFHPLHEWHAGASLALNRWLTELGQPPGARWLGSQYLVKAVKPG
jgi:ubiquinone/menaquinone biosynthesis C-methylase UbiE